MDERDPRRWTTPDADVPDALREVLRSAAADEAGAARVASFVGRVKSSLAAAPTPAPRFGTAKSLAAVVAGGALVAWLAFGSSSTTRTRTHEPAPELAAQVPAPAAQSIHAPSPAAPAAASAATTSAPAASVAPAPTNAPAPGANPASHNPADTLEREVRLLQAVRQLLDSDPAGALRLAEQHRARFPNGVLAQEREVLSIQALAREGRTIDAESRADRFRRQYPGSAHLDQLPGAHEQSHN